MRVLYNHEDDYYDIYIYMYFIGSSSLGQRLDDDCSGRCEFAFLVLWPRSCQTVANARGRHVSFAIHAIRLRANLVPRELYVNLFGQPTAHHEPYNQPRPDDGRDQVNFTASHESLVKVFRPYVIALQVNENSVNDVSQTVDVFFAKVL